MAQASTDARLLLTLSRSECGGEAGARVCVRTVTRRPHGTIRAEHGASSTLVAADLSAPARLIASRSCIVRPSTVTTFGRCSLRGYVVRKVRKSPAGWA